MEEKQRLFKTQKKLKHKGSLARNSTDKAPLDEWSDPQPASALLPERCDGVETTIYCFGAWSKQPEPFEDIDLSLSGKESGESARLVQLWEPYNFPINSDALFHERFKEHMGLLDPKHAFVKHLHLTPTAKNAILPTVSITTSGKNDNDVDLWEVQDVVISRYLNFCVVQIRISLQKPEKYWYERLHRLLCSTLHHPQLDSYFKGLTLVALKKAVVEVCQRSGRSSKKLRNRRFTFSCLSKKLVPGARSETTYRHATAIVLPHHFLGDLIAYASTTTSWHKCLLAKVTLEKILLSILTFERTEN